METNGRAFNFTKLDKMSLLATAAMHISNKFKNDFKPSCLLENLVLFKIQADICKIDF